MNNFIAAINPHPNQSPSIGEKKIVMQNVD
jgi:hypothetical protein